MPQSAIRKPQSKRVLLPPVSQNYSCHSCGHCCRNYTVPVTPEERQRIIDQHWEFEPDFADVPLFGRSRSARGYVLNQRDDGSCVFLSQEGRCKIHEKFGEPAKPLGCRMYPFVLNPVGDRLHVSLRFDCPSVIASRGRGLDQHRKDIAGLGAEVIATRPALRLRFRGGHALPDEHLAAAGEACARLIEDRTMDLTRRVLACADLGHLMRVCNLSKVAEKSRMSEFLDQACKVVGRAAAVNPIPRREPSRVAALFFRQVLALYGRRERWGQRPPYGNVETSGKCPLNVLSPASGDTEPARPRPSTRRRMRDALATMRGTGTVPEWQPGLPGPPFEVMEQSFGIPDGPVAEILERNLRFKLRGLGFFGPVYYNFSFVEGLFSLLLTYPLTLWYARLFAGAENENVISEQSVARALHVVEAPYARRPVFRLFTERYRVTVLTQEENLRSLVGWYGS